MIEVWNGQTDLQPLVESWSSEQQIDVEQCMRDLTSLRECVNSDVIVLNVNDPVGLMGIQTVDMFFTKECYSNVPYWYVLDKYRFLIREMVDFARRWSKQMACEKILVCFNKFSVPAIEMGLEKFETVYIGNV